MLLVRAEELKVSFNDLVLKACAKALTRFPTVNASWTGEAIQTREGDQLTLEAHELLSDPVARAELTSWEEGSAPAHSGGE